MFVSLNWLREYIDFDLTAEELAEKLLLTGTAIESVGYLGRDMDNIVVGQIKAIKKHPNADTLTLCRVDIGTKELQIVCGATNMKEKDKVAVALVGARLPNSITLKKANIRGCDSEGMMCSAVELGVGEDASGLLILDPETKVGISFASAYGLEDIVLELEVTPNRPDCLSMIGIAREVGAITGRPYRKPNVILNEVAEKASSRAQVEILDSILCPRYVARVITGVKIGPSPAWMWQRLEKAGIRPINNIVDVTNYVMMELGQPLHAFDHDRITQGKIIVRRAEKDEIMVTLDDVSRRLNEDMLVIADPKGPVALAGVMGGAFSEVSSSTKNILLESANFNPVSIGRTSRGLGLISEASIRFERGVDPNGALFAADRAAQLMAELAGGKALREAVDVYPREIKPWLLILRVSRANDILGAELTSKQVSGILKALDLDVSVEGSGTRVDRLKVTVPTFRPDLEREIDLIEEVARLHGYDKIETTLPESRGRRGGLKHEQVVREMVRDHLVSSGLYEVVTYGFIDDRHFDLMGLPPDDKLRQAVRLKNPVSEDQSIMRTTLVPGLLNVIRHNVNRGETDVAVFEMGKAFSPRRGELLPEESLSLAGALTGSWRSKEWYEEARKVDFYDAKGVLEALFEKLGIGDRWTLERIRDPVLHQGRQADILVGKDRIGWLGELRPEVQAAYELSERVIIFEVELDKLVDLADLAWEFQEIPRFPSIALDIAALVDEKVKAADVQKTIGLAGGKLLKEVRLFDFYDKDPVPRGKKSLAYSLTFRADDRTLTDEEAKKAYDRIVAQLKKELKAEIRTA